MSGYMCFEIVTIHFFCLCHIVGPRGSFEHQSVKRYPVSLANAKPFNSYVSPKSNAAFGSGVQRKLDMVNEKH